MLQNPVYIGKISHDETIHEGKHAPIIDLDTWQRAQELADTRALTSATRAPNESSYLLSGLLHCAVRGNSYVAVSANGRKNTYRYYTCRTRQTHAVDRVRDALNEGEPTVIKHMLRQFIHRIEISSDWEAHPIYLVPVTPVPEPQAARVLATAVRINEPFVELS
jgi:hypothetical protein